MTLPLMALLFIPIIVGIPSLYEWADPAHVAHDPILQAKSAYLNVPFFTIRLIGIVLILAVFMFLLIKNSRKQENENI